MSAVRAIKRRRLICMVNTRHVLLSLRQTELCCKSKQIRAAWAIREEAKSFLQKKENKFFWEKAEQRKTDVEQRKPAARNEGENAKQ